MKTENETPTKNADIPWEPNPSAATLFVDSFSINTSKDIIRLRCGNSSEGKTREAVTIVIQGELGVQLYKGLEKVLRVDKVSSNSEEILVEE